MGTVPDSIPGIQVRKDAQAPGPGEPGVNINLTHTSTHFYVNHIWKIICLYYGHFERNLKQHGHIIQNLCAQGVGVEGILLILVLGKITLISVTELFLSNSFPYSLLFSVRYVHG